jgi:hypothetical protein
VGGVLDSSHRMFHPLPADKMEVHMEDGLTAMDAGVVDDAVSALTDSLAFGEDPRHIEDVTNQRLVPNFKRVDRFDVPVRHDQDVDRCNGMQVAEGGHLLIAVENGGGGISGDDSTEYAIGIYLVHQGCQSCIEMDGKGFHGENST